MKFGIPEIKAFAESHEDERVRIMYARLCEARSKNAKWCEALEKLQKKYDDLVNLHKPDPEARPLRESCPECGHIWRQHSENCSRKNRR